MIDHPRSDQSADIATRADERAKAAQRDINRVERALTERIEHLGEVVTKGFDNIGNKLDEMSKEISELKIENGKRTGFERTLKWLITLLVTVALGIAGSFYTGINNPQSHH